MGRLWSGVIAIYGPLLIAIICLIISACIQLKREQELVASGPSRRRMRRPGVVDHTAPMSRTNTMIDDRVHNRNSEDSIELVSNQAILSNND